MPMFVDALLGDTLHCDAELFGAYHFILYATWRNNGEPLDDDAETMARICRMPLARFTKLRPVLVRFFDLTDGKWRQKRLEKEWAAAILRQERARTNGAGGGRPKAKPKNNPVGLLDETQSKPKDNQVANPHESYPNPISNIEDSVTSVTGGKPPDLATLVFTDGLKFLISKGVKEPQARSVLGRWRGIHGDAALIEVLGSAKREGAIDAISFIEGCFRARGSKGKRQSSLDAALASIASAVGGDGGAPGASGGHFSGPTLDLEPVQPGFV